MIDAICHALIGALLTALFAWLTHVRNAVSRKEMVFALKDADSKFVSIMKANNTILGSIQGDVNTLKIDVAVLKSDSQKRGHHA